MAPTLIPGLAGATVIDCSVVPGSVTVSTVDPVAPCAFAVMVDHPAVIPFARPVPSMDAAAPSDELHVAKLVRSTVLPSLYIPVAVNGCEIPASSEEFAGVTAIVCSLADPTVRPAVPIIEPSCAATLLFP